MRRLLLCCLLLGSLTTPVYGATKEQRYIGVHQLGVNRVGSKRRSGSVRVTQGERGLRLEGAARSEPFYLELSGDITRIDERVLELSGELRGVPDKTWADERPTKRATSGKFTFRVTKGRKFWRLYEVDGQGCVCDDGCGNDFCYIDIDLKTE